MTSLFEKRFILVVGKGGVGRSTVAASIAAACARKGRKTLLFEANAKDRFGEFFGRPAVGTDIVRLADNLHAINTTPAHALEEYGLMVLRFRRVYKLVFENRITEAFIKAIPGIEDYALLGKAWFHTTETKGRSKVWDTVVFDMAASGHSLSMLQIPWSIMSAVPEGPLTQDAREIQKLLLDASLTSTVMVTMAEDMPSNEAIDLAGQMRSLMNLPITELVINQLYRDRFPAGSPQAQVLEALEQSDALSSDLEALREHGEQCRSRRALNETYLSRLAKAMHCPTAKLPRLFVPKLGRDEIDDLSRQLEDAL